MRILVDAVARTKFGEALRRLRGCSFGSGNLDYRLNTAIEVSNASRAILNDKRFAARTIRVIIAQSVLAVAEPLTDKSDGYAADEYEKVREANGILREVAFQFVANASNSNQFEAFAFRSIIGA